ncbi:MAG TPA: hypothetical protein GX003_01795 [Acholeplasmataceae bacterium]|jgi:hypothetical protein|nr:hypothetical protein [Acholeplasmataceae bacterium]
MKTKTNQELITLYSELIQELKNRKVIRTKNFLGDLGEYLAVQILNSKYDSIQLELQPPSTKNYDAVCKNTNSKYSIKSMTVNQTSIIDRTNSKEPTNLAPTFDYLVLMKFNSNYSLEQIYLLSWIKFIEYRKWHNTDKGWFLTITNKLKDDNEVIKVL